MKRVTRRVVQWGAMVIVTVCLSAVILLDSQPLRVTTATVPAPRPNRVLLPVMQAPKSVPVATETPTEVLESFEEEPAQWQVTPIAVGGGTVQQSSITAYAGSYSAQLQTEDAGQIAQIQVDVIDSAGSQAVWGERPGRWFWQRARVYIPSTTVHQLSSNQYFTLGGFWPSTSDQAGWWLRVRADGDLTVYGFDANGTPEEFRIYSSVPLDAWFELELGRHSQNGPGVKQAFAILINGQFYGWYHQGAFPAAPYDRVALGLLATNGTGPLTVYLDEWGYLTTDAWPSGADLRPTLTLQEQDYRTEQGDQWQIDWSTWRNDLRLHSTFGLYSETDRLQSGRNLDRMPDLTEGWAEIEIDWPKGTPPTTPNGYFGPMVGFRKEINREENLEVIPIGQGNGNVDLALEAWAGGPVIYATWSLPLASVGGTHLPEPGDIIRARWTQPSATEIRAQADYYDASQAQWHLNVIDHTLTATAVGNSDFGPVNFMDGYHTASSITIDSPHYSIRRYRVGTLATYPP